MNYGLLHDLQVTDSPGNQSTPGLSLICKGLCHGFDLSEDLQATGSMPVYE
jgi:hypothetical protein